MTTKDNQQNNTPRCGRVDLLKALKKNIVIRGLLCIITVALTGVLLFAVTLAWSNNILHTSDLTFKAEKWNFEGDIEIFENVASIAPGDSGTVLMRINNGGQTPVSASVSVSKNKMSDAMKSRLYFYVEDSAIRHGEKVEKLYLTSRGGYTYTLFPSKEILVSHEYRNVAPIKWEWVYDVLGYYVMGSLVDGNVVVHEYIRPIVYEYDPLETTFGEDGELISVDGSITAMGLLNEISLKDGYEGRITSENKSNNGYYRVDVDEKGNGVWARLCSYQEIAANMEQDTLLGSDDANVSCKAVVSITGQNMDTGKIGISSENQLISALSDAEGTTIRLTSDIIASDIINVPAGKTVVIDLDGHTISSNSTEIFYAEENSNLMLADGHLAGGVGTAVGITSVGADITLDNIMITGAEDAVTIKDNTCSSGTDSFVSITGCKLIGSSSAINVYSNGEAENEGLRLVIEDSELEGISHSGISCNGSFGGTNIDIIDSTVSGYYTSIYHPQANSTLNIRNSTLEGWTGLAIKGGTVNVIDSTVKGTGAAGEPGHSHSGWMDTGDGIYLETTYDRTTNIYISGTSTLVTSVNAQAVRKYEYEATHAQISISGGSFSTDVAAYLADGVAVTFDGEVYKVE